MGSTPTFGTITFDGAWLSLVERSVRDAEAGGSNPLAPTTNTSPYGLVLLLSSLSSHQTARCCNDERPIVASCAIHYDYLS